jgi:hypothetical protein
VGLGPLSNWKEGCPPSERRSGHAVETSEARRWPVPQVPEAASRVPRAVRARRPNHIWMVDLTDVKGMFSLVTSKVRVVFDAVLSNAAIGTGVYEEAVVG